MSHNTSIKRVVPVLLTGLLLTACSSEDRDAAKEKMDAAKETVSETASKAVEETKEAANAAVENTKEAASTVVEETKEAVNNVVEETKEAATAAADTAKEMASDTKEAVADAVAPASSDAKGKEVYDSVCFACHNIGLAGAPKLGDAAAWTDRIAQGNDVLYDHAINGYVGPSGSMMPAKGGRADLSDEDTKAAVDYMVANSQ